MRLQLFRQPLRTELRRFFASTWAWVGGNREWHAGSARYRGAGDE